MGSFGEAHFLLGLVLSLITVANSLQCLSCRGVKEPRLCTTVRTCPAGNACSLQTFNSSRGDISYVLDCMSHSFCNMNISTSSNASDHHSSLMCSQCCKTDICNMKGCASHVSGHFSERGPICYSCPHVTNPDQCHNVDQCGKDEYCAVFLDERFGTRFYSSRCIPGLDCRQSSGMAPEIGKRRAKRESEKICPNCCNADLCNSYCEESSTTVSHGTFSTISPLITTQPSSSESAMTVSHGTFRTVPQPKTTHAPPPGSSGYEFLVQFLPVYSFYNHNNNPQILIQSSTTGSYYLDGPDSAEQTGNLSMGLDTVSFNVAALSDNNIIESKAIYLKTSVPIFLFKMNYEYRTSDMCLVFPVEICSTEYVVPSFKPAMAFSEWDKHIYSVIGISAVHNDTNVTVILRMASGKIKYQNQSYTDGESLSLSLQRLQSFTLSHNYDLSGTRISSSKPVCVTSGDTCAYSGVTRGCSRFEEMIPPVEQFSFQFIVPPVYTRNGNIARVTNYEKTANINIGMNNTQQNRTLEPYSYTDIDITSDIPITVSSNTSVLVTMYPKISQSNGPFMSLVPGIDQYLYEYNFGVPDLGFTSYVSIVVPYDQIDGIRVDEKPLNPFSNSTDLVNCNGTDYKIVFASVSPGAHVINHTHSIPFAVFVYGNQYGDAYGNIAGIKFH